MIMQDLSNWTPRLPPQADIMEGRFVRLERLSAARHGDGLYACSTMEDADARFRWLPEYPPQSRAAFQPWLDKAEASSDPLYYAVIDKASGKVAGRQTFLRTDTANGVTEIGHVFWSSLIARGPAATEAFYLFARHVFDDLGYRRFEWKCNDRNGPSKRAAERFGFTFEGVFRQHLIVKGENRDTAWYSLLDREWPLVKAAFETWLAPENFDAVGRQRVALSTLTARRIETGGIALQRVGPEARAVVETVQNEAYARTREALGTQPMPLDWDYRQIVEQCEIWFAPPADRPAGALILRRRPTDLYLESIATVPQVAGTGLGRAMMQAAFDRARALALPEIRMMTNTRNPAVAWYKRLGFVIEREEKMDDRTAVHLVAAVARND
jgi:RimJ/RimL family protein N-acetyltransferase